MNTLSEKLKGFRPYQLEEINYSKVFYKLSEVRRIKEHLKPRDYCRELKEVIHNIIYTNQGFVEQGKNAKQLFILSPIGERKDIKDFFFHLWKLNEGQDLIYWEKKDKILLNRTLKKLINTLRWFLQLIPTVSFYESLICLKALLRIKDVEYEIESKFNKKSYNIVTFLCDALYIDNYLSQKFQKRGVTTATLQHGIMLAPRNGLENNLDYIGVEFKSSVCNKFLIWNNFTLQEGLKAGVNSKVFEILGLIKCIGKEHIDISHAPKKVFGIILDGKLSDENNIPVLNIANQFAQKHNWKYIVRFHPAYSTHEFDHIIDFNRGCICERNIDLITFFMNTDFSIVSNSTVLFEMAYFRYPTIKYSSGNISDKFLNLKYPSFNNYLGLEKQFENFNQNNITTLFNELCGSITDISKSYRDFYNKYL